MTQQQEQSADIAEPTIEAEIKAGIKAGTEAEIEAVPGIPAELDRGVFWVRTGWDLEAEWPRMLAAFMAAETDPETGEPIGHEGLRMTGFYFAANWTARMSTTAPMTNRPEKVTGRTLTEQMDRARRAASMDIETAPYALGVLEWLEWMTAKRTQLVYPAPAA